MIKRRLLYFYLSFCSLFCAGQIVVSTCLAPDSVVHLYKKSADKLAVRRAEYIADTYKDSIHINKLFSNNYLKALLAVYNATALPARDTVVIVPIVADFKMPPDLNSIFFTADSSQQWMKNLKNNIIPCGNSSIDSMISRYYLKKTDYSVISYVYPYHLVAFRTDSNCYINRLCDKFNSFLSLGFGFLTAYPNNEGRSEVLNITDSINSNFIELTYSLGWGGCMLPCMYHRYWKFRVYNNCSVEYKGDFGDPMPFNLFAGIKNNYQENEIKVFPNPVSDKLKIEFIGQVPSKIEISIFNSFGQAILHQTNYNSSEPLDVSQLQNGIYYIKLNSNKRSIVSKFVIHR